MSLNRRRRISITLLLGAVSLILSLAANVILVRGLSEAFAKLQYSRIFPLGYVDEGVPSAGTGANTVALFGDSRAEMWHMRLPDGYRFLNCGHGGQTSRQLLLQLKEHREPHTHWAIVQIGINDLHPIGALPGERIEIISSLRRNISAIAAELLKRSDYVIWTTIFPPSPVPLLRRAFWDAKTLSYIDSLNQVIRKFGDSDRTFVLDSHTLLADKYGYLYPQFASSDFFLHVNEHAYGMLDKAVIRILTQTEHTAPSH